MGAAVSAPGHGAAAAAGLGRVGPEASFECGVGDPGAAASGESSCSDSRGSAGSDQVNGEFSQRDVAKPSRFLFRFL